MTRPAWIARIIGVTILVPLIVPGYVGAYNGPAHQYFAKEAVKLLDFTFPALDPTLTTKLAAIIDGAGHEDVEDHIWGHGGWWVTCTHFWNADSTDLHENYNFVGTDCANAYMKADELFDQVFQFYLVDGDVYSAYERLGHIAHLIGDMTVPAHAHVDKHLEFDSYDDGWSGTTGEGSHPPNYEQFDYINARIDGGLIEVPQSAIAEVLDNPGAGYDLGWNSVAKAKLYYLLYTAQQTGDYLPSDDDDGDEDDRHHWMNYQVPPYPAFLHDEDGNLTRQKAGIRDNWWFDYGNSTYYFDNHDGDFSTIGRNSMVYAIRAIAGLYKAFRDTFDPNPPVTTPTVRYDYPPNQGWTRGNVTISLEAEDDFSGLYNTLWTVSSPPGPVASDLQHFDEGEALSSAILRPTTITSEGTHHYTYFSNDWFGNVEDPASIMVSIDKTGPSVTSTTPTASGFYLTSGTLTVDWDVTDELSGIASIVATLDGAPVAIGDMIDLATMGGYHSFVLAATDVAGNVTTETVEFSVMIHGAVVFKPNSINVKSNGDKAATYTEFPSGYEVGQIDVSTVRVVFENWLLSAEPEPTALSDFDKDGIPDRLIKFDRANIIQAVMYTPPPQGFTDPLVVPLVVRGQLFDGTEFYADTNMEFTHTL